jgi:hypothetical protein
VKKESVSFADKKSSEAVACAMFGTGLTLDLWLSPDPKAGLNEI